MQPSKISHRLPALLLALCSVPLATPPAMAEPPLDTTRIPDDVTVELSQARKTANQAADLVRQLRMDLETRKLLSRSQAVFLVPNYGRASLGIGGAYGRGVLVAQHEDGWSAPLFYNIGAINLGLAAGAEAGSIAFFIMQERALDGFTGDNNFALNADAGLTLIDFSRRGQLSAGKGADVIVWSDTEGLYGDLAISVSDIYRDDEANRSYYQTLPSVPRVLSGEVQDAFSLSELQAEFSALEAPPEDPPPQALPRVE